MAGITKEERARRKAEKEAVLNIPEVFPTLEFTGFGWCEELKRSYKRGYYKPKNKKEYEALKKHAK